MKSVTQAVFSLVFFVASFWLVACGSSGSGGGRASAIDGPAAHALVAQGATLVDVRTSAEWQGGHVDGAKLIPIQELSGRLAEIPRDHPVVVYCASGARSARAAATLAAAGYDARDLGGMSRWD